MTERQGPEQVWARSNRFVPRNFVRPLNRFLAQEASSGIALVAATVLALLWANLSPDSYNSVFSTPFVLELGPLLLEEDLHGLINDGLMAIFFFVVGLEIKRELTIGELRDRRTAFLPALAALGGMVVPAAVYLFIAGGVEGAERGWGVPMATDIAFALGVLSLAGRRIPSGAKLFLLSLAIADDIGAIAVIALFYTSDISLPWLGIAVFLILAVAGASRAGIRSYGFYVPMAVFVWLSTLESGIHPTIAGVILGLVTPVRPFYRLVDYRVKAESLLAKLSNEDDDALERETADHYLENLASLARESVSPLARIEHQVGVWSANLIVPVFALANAGINFSEGTLNLTSRITLGVALGLIVGKTVGVTAFALLGIAAGLRLPDRMHRGHLVGVAILAGIGFTVAIFVAGLAFDNPDFYTDARLGIFAASLVAALVGWAVMRSLAKRGV